jgi:hypothetical protein
MEEQKVQTNNNITANKTLIAVSPNENNLHTVVTLNRPAGSPNE